MIKFNMVWLISKSVEQTKKASERAVFVGMLCWLLSLDTQYNQSFSFSGQWGLIFNFVVYVTLRSG